MKKAIPFITLLLLLAAAYLWQRLAAAPVETPGFSPVALLAEENTVGFARATEPGDVRFPRDLGAHDDYQTEWWYYTGNLQAENGRRFGFQLTFFRRAVTPPAAQPVAGEETASRWRTNQIYLAHFTVSDIVNENFYPFERFSRGAAGLAGGQADPYRVWLENWYVEQESDGVVRLFAEADGVALDLTLTERLPPVLHGDGGLSAKGPEPGNASYYYSIVQQQAAGTVTLPGETVAVRGQVWKDHEYSTSALSPEAVGWDWFSIQLDDGSALMLFQIRHRDGTVSPFSAGSFISSAGAVQSLALGEWALTVTDEWTSPRSGATYPAGWRLAVPTLALTLEGRPFMADQELNVSTTYWEGATGFSGFRNGEPVEGQGYVEMTGYEE